MSQDGLVSVPVLHPTPQLIERIETELKARGITIFARIDHAAGAAAVGQALRPTVVLIFGNPAAGTPLMQAEQTIGLDLPLKILAWEDASGISWLSYHDPAWLARCHGIDPATQPTLAAMTSLYAALTADF
jgi:uncharacterized protein (DUF302 family)